MYKYIGYANYAHTCEHCGHDIAHVYTIRHIQTGVTLRVGSECVLQLLDLNERPVFEREQARRKRAASQWRTQKPAAHEGETREQYIERRVCEMSNALAAFKAWSGLFGRGVTLYSLAIKSLQESGVEDPSIYGRQPHYTYPDSREIVNPGHEGYSHNCPLCQQQEGLKKAYVEMVREEQEAVVRRFEEKHQANRFDFNRAVWNVKKL